MSKRKPIAARDTLWGQLWIQSQEGRENKDMGNVVDTVGANDDILFVDADAEEEEENQDEKLRKELEEQSMLLALNNDSAPDLVGADDVPDVPVTWLWKGYLSNEITLLTGASGSMKTHLSCKIAAMFSAGQTLPDGELAPQFPVIMINQEDKLTELKRRLKANKADMSNVKFLSEVVVNDPENIRVAGKQPFQLPRDLPVLKRAIAAIGAGMVVIDPVGAVCHNSKNDGFVREHIMTPLTQMCEDMDVCVIFINHTRRGNFNEKNFLSFMSNAKAFHEASRMSCLIMPEPGNDGVSVWKQVKNSNGKTMPQLRYCIEETPLSNGPYVKFLESQALSLPQLTTDYAKVQQSIMALIYREGNEEIGVHQAKIVQSLSLMYPASTVRMSLGRMVQATKLERTARGIYNLPISLRRRIV